MWQICNCICWWMQVEILRRIWCSMTRKIHENPAEMEIHCCKKIKNTKNGKILRQIQSCTQIPTRMYGITILSFYAHWNSQFSLLSVLYDVVVDTFPRHFIFLIPRSIFFAAALLLLNSKFSFSVCGKTEAISICAGYFLLTLRWFSSRFFLYFCISHHIIDEKRMKNMSKLTEKEEQIKSKTAENGKENFFFLLLIFHCFVQVFLLLWIFSWIFIFLILQILRIHLNL